jgi:hypothetical protein
MNKIATKKGEPRINPTTTKWILEQFYIERRKQKDIWLDISDKCSLTYVKNVIQYPRSYVSGDIFESMTKRYEEKLVSKKCLHPRSMLITEHGENIRCVKCNKIWVPK